MQVRNLGLSLEDQFVAAFDFTFPPLDIVVRIANVKILPLISILAMEYGLAIRYLRRSIYVVNIGNLVYSCARVVRKNTCQISERSATSSARIGNMIAMSVQTSRCIFE